MPRAGLGVTVVVGVRIDNGQVLRLDLILALPGVRVSCRAEERKLHPCLLPVEGALP
jgi:hypothetical protein